MRMSSELEFQAFMALHLNLLVDSTLRLWFRSVSGVVLTAFEFHRLACRSESSSLPLYTSPVVGRCISWFDCCVPSLGRVLTFTFGNVTDLISGRMHASNLLKVVLKPRSITSSSSGQSLNTKDSKPRSSPRASTPETSLSLSVSKKATRAPAKMSCLCAPTNHAGSFRCRLHRGNQQSWGGKPLTPAAPPVPVPKPTSPPQAAESRPSASHDVPHGVGVENGLSKRLLQHQSSRHPSNNFFHPHTHRSCDGRPSRLSRVSVATEVDTPVVEETTVRVPTTREAPGTMRYLKFTGGAGCASAAVLEAGVVAIKKLQVSSKKDVMLDVFGSGTGLSRAGFAL